MTGLMFLKHADNRQLVEKTTNALYPDMTVVVLYALQIVCQGFVERLVKLGVCFLFQFSATSYVMLYVR